MNQRIRYIKDTDPAWMIGNKYYKDQNGSEYQVKFKPSEYGEGYVGHITGDTVDGYIIVLASSAHKIKIELKKVLEQMGCQFEKESRGGKDETIGD